MKNWLRFLFALPMIGSWNISLAQKSITGIWEGKLRLNIELRIVFHFSKDSTGKWVATLDSPDQGAKDIKASGVTISGDSLVVDIASINGHYMGQFQNDSMVTGKWKQGGSYPLDIRKVEKPSELARPQTPKPPFPYASEDVEYDNADKSIHYGATLTIPDGKGPFPAAVMITGSGQQNRDEEIFGHKSFAVIADYLTRQGYAVLRVDDRGIGKSTGDFAKSTSLDFAKDVETSLNYLESRKEIDTKKVGLIGHSEGGMIAPMVASNRKDVSFLILLAGPGVKITELMEGQTAAVLKSAGVQQAAVDQYLVLYRKIVPEIIHAETETVAEEKVFNEVQEWRKTSSPAVALSTTGVTNDSTAKIFASRMAGTLYSPWFKYFLSYDPAPAVQKLNCKVLALNGEKDIQVLAVPNLAGLDAALKKSHSPKYETKLIPGLNHLFQHCKLCSVAEYGQLEETFSPEVLKLMSDWLNKEVK